MLIFVVRLNVEVRAHVPADVAQLERVLAGTVVTTGIPISDFTTPTAVDSGTDSCMSIGVTSAAELIGNVYRTVRVYSIAPVEVNLAYREGIRTGNRLRYIHIRPCTLILPVVPRTPQAHRDVGVTQVERYFPIRLDPRNLAVAVSSLAVAELELAAIVPGVS